MALLFLSALTWAIFQDSRAIRHFTEDPHANFSAEGSTSHRTIHFLSGSTGMLVGDCPPLLFFLSEISVVLD